MMGQAETVKHVLLNRESEAALRAVLQRSLHRVLPGGQVSVHWSMSALQDRNAIVDQELVMLTISAYTFRVIVLLHFSLNEAVQRLVSELLKAPASKLNTERILDCLSELGNSLCGEIKRELAHVNPHLGMSTPNRLNHNNLIYVDDLSMVFDTHWQILHDGSPVIVASLYACAYAQVDFRSLIDDRNIKGGETSALELF